MIENLTKLEKPLKIFLGAYLVSILAGLSIGLYYVSYKATLNPSKTAEYYRGSEAAEGNELIVENYPKQIEEMLLTTHNHLLGLGFIIFSIGLIFYFNTIIKGVWKNMLMIDPIISLMITFGSIWLVRFVDRSFIYLTYLSSAIMYASLYVMILVSLYNLMKKEKR